MEEGSTMTAEEKRAQREAKKKEKQMKKQKKTGGGDTPALAPASAPAPASASASASASAPASASASASASAPAPTPAPASTSAPSAATTSSTPSKSVNDTQYSTPLSSSVAPGTPLAPSAPVPTVEKERQFQSRAKNNNNNDAAAGNAVAETALAANPTVDNDAAATAAAAPTLPRLVQTSKLNPNAATFVPGALSPPSKSATKPAPTEMPSVADSPPKLTTTTTMNSAKGNDENNHLKTAVNGVDSHVRDKDKKTSSEYVKTDASADASKEESKTMSKAELKKMRREKQEAQRAAKDAENAAKSTTAAAAAVGKGKSTAAGAAAGGAAASTSAKEKKTTEKPTTTQDNDKTQLERKKSGQENRTARHVPDSRQADNAKKVRKVARTLERQGLAAPEAMKKGSFFHHLPLYERKFSLTKTYDFNTNCPVHPYFLRIGLQLHEGKIQGSNARCLALMMAMKQLISDYSLTPNTEISRDLESKLRPNISFIDLCRSLSVSQGSFIKFAKSQISKLDRKLTESEAKGQLLEKIEDYRSEKILLAGEAILEKAKDKIKDGDVVMTYSCSSIVTKVILDAKKRGVDFRVIVVDGRPKNEGLELLRRLSAAGVDLTYIDINFVSHIINQVTKVFLGAAALLANGCVMSRVGSAQLALVAKWANKPVIVCCETYKFCERVQTDAIVSNELGDPTPLVAKDSLLPANWKEVDKLTVLNLNYDITPPNLIALVITELGAIPCTSVPVVLRVKEAKS